MAIRPYGEAGFPTPTRLIEIYSERLLEHGQPAIPVLAEGRAELGEAAFPLRLGCAKTVTYCHSQGRNIPSLRRLAPDPLLEIAPAAAAGRGIADGDWVEVSTEAGRFAARARIVAELAPDAVFAQHGWIVPGGPGGDAARRWRRSWRRRSDGDEHERRCFDAARRPGQRLDRAPLHGLRGAQARMIDMSLRTVFPSD